MQKEGEVPSSPTPYPHPPHIPKIASVIPIKKLWCPKVGLFLCQNGRV